LTTLTVPAGLEEDSGRRPVPWRRMAWVTWRQHRLALSGVGALLAGLAVWLLTAGVRLHRAFAVATACHPATSLACSELVSRFDGMGQTLANGYVLQPVPALIGAFVGAPVLAREFESGTFRFAWTQGFGPWRWTLAKLVALAVAVVAAAEAFSALLLWYYSPYFRPGNQALGLSEVSRLNPGLFDLGGVGLAGWTLVAFAIGGLAGMLVRRALPAIVATLATYTTLALVTGTYVRQHYLAPIVTSNPGTWVVPGSAWVISEKWVTTGGRPVGPSVLVRVLQGAPPSVAGKGGGVPRSFGSVQYLVQHGYRLWTSYQPAGRFWPFQFIEAGWLLALSIVLIAATVWLVRRRPG
jgi:hypothetical protein